MAGSGCEGQGSSSISHDLRVLDRKSKKTAIRFNTGGRWEGEPEWIAGQSGWVELTVSLGFTDVELRALLEESRPGT